MLNATQTLIVIVLANPLLLFGDGNIIGNRCVSQRICANDGKERMVDENAEQQWVEFRGRRERD